MSLVVIKVAFSFFLIASVVLLILRFVSNLQKKSISNAKEIIQANDFYNAKKEITPLNKAGSVSIPKPVPLKADASQEGQAAIAWTKPFLKSLEWKRYEEVCMEYLRIKNCQADVTCVGADSGIDIKISDSNGVVFAVGQCKAWSKPIGVNLIRELYGVMAADRIKTGIFLTTSEFTNDALAFKSVVDRL